MKVSKQQKLLNNSNFKFPMDPQSHYSNYSPLKSIRYERKSKIGAGAFGESESFFVYFKHTISAKQISNSTHN